jgi:hypothetical protein
VALAACGGSDDGDAAPKRPKGLPADFNIQVFDCADWKRATPEVREYVVYRLHSISGDQVSGPKVEGYGATLTDEEAVELFDAQCASPRARGFVLFKLYAYARGFTGTGRGPSQP